MNGMQTHSFSDADGTQAVEYAREALETYAREGQRMDVGSVDDLLNKRGGVILRLRSTVGRGRLRGSAAIYDGRRIADALIDATVIAASSRTHGSEVKRSEIDTVKFSIALIEEVRITDTPAEDLVPGKDCPIITSEKEDGWLYPTFATNNDLSPAEYLSRTCKKVQKPPTAWEDTNVVIARTAPFTEENPPTGSVIREE